MLSLLFDNSVVRYQWQLHSSLQMFFQSLLAILLLQSSLAAHSKDNIFNYDETDNPQYPVRYFNPNDEPGSKLGGLLMKYDRSRDWYKDSDFGFEDEAADSVDKRERNGNYMRFGRDNTQHLRFGRNQARAVRDKENFMRLGRGFSEMEKDRRKRRTMQEAIKRNDDFLRFGRDGTFS
ncbi:unnamed protein product [Acanthoscelides obtectus]|uniref:Uncharacterized protein n=1 Tax=Acanthoscelides obtectus TaxID=200917 RepID=A0A9P0PUF8_ACAOB|nr:unnamed protein product [Acanthoscelides obtectus]CAK1669499.1 hypothetical protein AOBTE_LOCUS27036 [Acanthoscelides obtectus]